MGASRRSFSLVSVCASRHGLPERIPCGLPQLHQRCTWRPSVGVTLRSTWEALGVNEKKRPQAADAAPLPWRGAPWSAVWKRPSWRERRAGTVLKFFVANRLLTTRSAGKVHGGLARAGKVRGQTPKVDPTEKAKRPKGRALKRIQFNKRVASAGASISA